LIEKQGPKLSASLRVGLSAQIVAPHAVYDAPTAPSLPYPLPTLHEVRLHFASLLEIRDDFQTKPGLLE
jgi:hypothetical protein